MKKIIALLIAGFVLFSTNVFSDESYTAVVNPVGVISQAITYDDFTDGGGAAATLNLTATLPIGAIPLAWRVQTTTAFATVTSVTLLVGVSGDTDKFSASDGQAIQAVGYYADSALGEAVGCDAVNAAQTILLTATEDSEWGDITAGAFTIYFYYLRP